MAAPVKIRVGTRASELARWQAEWVRDRLAEAGVNVELVLISTRGDQQQSGPIEQLGTRGVFTKELQRALLDGRIDLAVHSLKDLPTDEVPGLVLAAVPERGPEGDALVSRQGFRLGELPEGAVIGTGSLRRRAQLWWALPSLRMHDLRGNVETRLAKLDRGEYDAIVLAEAGLVRLDLADRITEVLPKSTMLPAPSQGALGLETRAEDARARDVLSRLDDLDTHRAVAAERSLLATLRGGCLAPVGAWGRFESDDQLHLSGVVLSGDGRQRIEVTLGGDPDGAVDLGREVAEELIAQGASELIAASRDSA